MSTVETIGKTFEAPGVSWSPWDRELDNRNATRAYGVLKIDLKFRDGISTWEGMGQQGSTRKG